MSELILLCSSKETNQLIQLINHSNNKAESYVIISANYAASENLHKKKVQHKKLTDYSPLPETVAKKQMDWLKSWHNTPILDKKNIKDLLTYDGISLWWLMDYWFFNSSFYFNPTTSEIIQNLETIENLVKTEKPEKVVIVGETQIGEIMKTFCAAKKLPFRVIPNNFSTRIKISLKRRVDAQIPKFKLVLKWMRALFRKTYWSFLRFLGEKSNDLPVNRSINRIIIFSTDYCVPVYNLSTLELEEGDPYLYSVIDELKKASNNSITFVGVLRGYSFGLKVMNKQISNNKIFYKPFDSYLNVRMIIRTLKAMRKARGKLKTLIESKEFKKSLYYEDTPFYSLLKRRFTFFFTFFIFDMILHIELMKRLISVEKPDVIVITEETVLDGKAIIIVGKSNKIPIISVQHGIVGGQGITDYDHSPKDFGPNHEVTTPFCPIPDKIALYGNFYKQACTQVSKYPENILAVTGSPRYDILAYAKKIFEKDEICRELSSMNEYKLDPNKKIMTLLTQPLPSFQEREMVLKYTYEAVKKLNGVQLLVKLHPGELNDSLHKRLLRESGLENTIIVQNFDTYKLLFASDLVVAALSTTLLEAVALDKPVILLDLLKKGYCDFLECNEAMFTVYTKDELCAAISTLLFDSSYQKEINKGRNVFKYNHLYKMDGQASKRVADLVKNIIKP